MPKVNEAKTEIFNIPPCLIKPNPVLSRTEFSDTSLVSLADSIRRYGILQPLAVRLSEKGRYELIAGERRLRAAILLSMPTVPCVILERGERYEYLSVVENLQREGLGMFDEARAIKRLFEKNGRSVSETSRLLSISETELLERLRLCDYSRAEMQAISRLGLSRTQALVYLELPVGVRYYTIKLCTENGYSKSEIKAVCRAITENDAVTPDDLEALAQEVVSRERASSASKVRPEQNKAEVNKSERKTTVFLRDLRAFEISLEKTCSTLEKAGYKAEIQSRTDGIKTVYTVVVRQKKQKG